MRKLVEFQVLDKNVEHYGVSISELMQNAGNEISKYVIENYSSEDIITIVCGKGNNGGDGFVCASNLIDAGFNVNILITELPSSKISILYYKKLEDKVTEISFLSKFKEKTVLLVDCLLGSGITGSPRSPYDEYIDMINSFENILSVDVPSGFLSECSVKPRNTITFHDLKDGMNEDNCGEIILRGVGIPEEIEQKYFGVLTKVFNVARFASQFDVPANLEDAHKDLAIEDRWILAEFASVLEEVGTAWSQIDIYTAGQAVKTFGTGILPSHWLEMAKSRLYAGDLAAAWTLHRIVRDLLTVMSPITPFFTDYLSTILYGSSAIDVTSYPAQPYSDVVPGSSEGGRLREFTSSIIEFNSFVWKLKKDDGLSLNAEIKGVEVPDSLAEFTDTLVQMHTLV